MSVTEIPTQFRTSDNRKYPAKDAAERHQKFIDAKEEYENARSRFGRALAETQFTADGQQFTFGWSRYFYITESIDPMPSLREVNSLGYNVKFMDDDEDCVTLVQLVVDRYVHYRINELYVSREEAERALLVAQENWLAGQSAQVAEFRARIIPTVGDA